MHRDLLCVVAVVLVTCSTWQTAQAVENPAPNVVLVMMDNLGYGEPGVYGGGVLRGAPTPQIDSIAEEGLQLLNFNVVHTCTPSRAALMTGRYPVRTGNSNVAVDLPRHGFVDWEYTLAEMFTDAGYTTGIFGKWHLGRVPGRFPTDQGFDEWYGTDGSGAAAFYVADDMYDPDASYAGQPYINSARRGKLPEKVKVFDPEAKALLDRELTEYAIGFMQRAVEASKSFFAYIPYTMVGFPSTPHPDFEGKSGYGPYSDTLMEMDHNVGMLIDAIDELGIRDNTILIFTSDNGPSPAFPDKSSSGPWRGTLGTPYEGGLRVPFLMRWPGRVPEGLVSNGMVHIMDLYPTFARIIGRDVPSDRIIDGVDQLDLFTGKSDSRREGFVVYNGDVVTAIKWRNWKMLFYEYEGRTNFSPVKKLAYPHVHNLIVDEKEEYDVWLDHVWVNRAIRTVLTDHKRSLKEYPPIPPGAPDTYVPSQASGSR